MLAGRGDQPALIYDSPVTDTKSTRTFSELLEEVATFAGALADLGVGKGDRVVIYMPMIPEAIVAMLACARIGVRGREEEGEEETELETRRSSLAFVGGAVREEKRKKGGDEVNRQLHCSRALLRWCVHVG